MDKTANIPHLGLIQKQKCPKGQTVSDKIGLPKQNERMKLSEGGNCLCGNKYQQSSSRKWIFAVAQNMLKNIFLGFELPKGTNNNWSVLGYLIYFRNWAFFVCGCVAVKITAVMAVETPKHPLKTMV